MLEDSNDFSIYPNSLPKFRHSLNVWKRFLPISVPNISLISFIRSTKDFNKKSPKAVKTDSTERLFWRRLNSYLPLIRLIHCLRYLFLQDCRTFRLDGRDAGVGTLLWVISCCCIIRKYIRISFCNLLLRFDMEWSQICLILVPIRDTTHVMPVGGS